MGAHHSQEIIRHLNAWHTLAEKQLIALSKGDLEGLAKFIDQSVVVQTSLDTHLAGIHPHMLDKESIELMNTIQKIQETLVQEMQKGSAMLAEKIETLRKNTTSLKGYKQNPPGIAPQFFNKRT